MNISRRAFLAILFTAVVGAGQSSVFSLQSSANKTQKTVFSSQEETVSETILKYQILDTLPDELGVAGAFTGLLGPNKDILLVAGGANFGLPVWENVKEFHRGVFVGKIDGDPKVGIGKPRLKSGQAGIGNRAGIGNWEEDRLGGSFDWLPLLAELPQAVAYGSSVTVDEGVICMGGHNSERVMDNVYLIRYNESDQHLNIYDLPSLPTPATHGGAAVIGGFVYYTCGQKGLGIESATKQLWRLNISALGSFIADRGQPYPYNWEIMPSLPGKSRVVSAVVAQHNGRNQALYVISGRRLKDDYTGDEPYELLNDVWEYDPLNPDKPWTQKADAPVCLMAAPAIEYGQSHIFVLGGADGSLIYQADALRDEHPGFPKTAWAYHTITDTWTNLGEIPANQVTTTALQWGNKIIIPSGEIRPRVRSNIIWEVELISEEAKFGWLNYTTLVVYLLAMLMVGVYFTRRNKSTNDFFRGGQRIPWWAAACSIFATMLSSLTYMSVPAKAYMTNWEYLLGYPAILLTSILVIYLIMPFFRKIDATSAYEYLEKRFNKTARYMGSAFFILFQIGRMAIVMFLSALALSAITPFTAAQCILIMGILSIIYSTLGGVEAVIWTDTIQTFVLLGGAILIFVLVLLKLDGGMNELVQVASADQKFKMINWDWDIFSYTTAAFWVIIIGGFGQNLVSYGSDQAIIQRYMTTADQKKSAKSILANGIIALPAGLLFFAVGTALYVFYKSHPGNLDPAFQNDAIMPLFIVQEIPKGLAGLIIAGVFAAAQSTISTSMNSTATSAVTDFFKPWNVRKTDKGYLRLARLLTIIFGLAGTAIALVFASADIKSLLDQFFAILGLFGGALGGMFLLGMFTRKANATGAVAGAIIGAISLFFVSTYTDTHVYLYAAIGIVITMLSGWVISVITKGNKKDIKQLTVWQGGTGR
ncbi:MAG: sodium/solute symporter [Bacteroidetes bacterium]|nr:sodium/solute symporter [Bacteroidota bacterium]